MRGKSKENRFCFELAGNSSYRRFELSGFNCSPFVCLAGVWLCVCFFPSYVFFTCLKRTLIFSTKKKKLSLNQFPKLVLNREVFNYLRATR